MTDTNNVKVSLLSEDALKILPDVKSSGFINIIKEIVSAGFKSHKGQVKEENYNIHFTQNLKKYSTISSSPLNYVENFGRNDVFNESKAAAMKCILFAHENIEQNKRLERTYLSKRRQSCIFSELMKHQSLSDRSAVFHALQLNKTRQDNREALFTALSLVEGVQFEE
ncbi:unnamed protein product [Heterobilharzia americana]|nr:unnamed protein product [Heterobilharzia americana]